MIRPGWSGCRAYTSATAAPNDDPEHDRLVYAQPVAHLDNVVRPPRQRPLGRCSTVAAPVPALIYQHQLEVVPQHVDARAKDCVISTRPAMQRKKERS